MGHRESLHDRLMKMATGMLALALLAGVSGCRVGGKLAAKALPIVVPSPQPLMDGPIIDLPAQSPFSSRDDQLSIQGRCLFDHWVRLAGDASGEALCTSGSFEFEVEKLEDGIYSFILTQEDPDGRISGPTPLLWLRKTSIAPPVLTSPVTQGPGVPFASALGSLSLSGTCEPGATVTLSGAQQDAQPCLNHAFSFNISQANEGQFAYTLTHADSAGNSANLVFTWDRALLRLLPASSQVPVETGQQMSATGGSGNYSFALKTNASGGALHPVTRIMTTGTLAWVSDILEVTDSHGVKATAAIEVRPATADRLVLLSDLSPEAGPGDALPQKIRARVVDRHGNKVVGTQVLFKVTEGEAEILDPLIQTSDSQGVVEVSARMGHIGVRHRIRLARPGVALPDATGTGQSELEVTVRTATTGTAEFGLSQLTGNVPSALLVRDLNADGFNDVVSADYGDSTVSVHLGTGQGWLLPRQTVSVCAAPKDIAAEDLNGDLRPDLLWACSGDDKLGILIASPSGGYLALGNLTSLGAPSSLAVTDMDGDGKLDVVVSGNSDSSLRIFLGAGDGSFTEGPVLSTQLGPSSVVAGDFNGDGLKDLAVSESGNSTLSVFLRIAGGQIAFGPPISLGTGLAPTRLLALRLNNDAVDDLVVASNGDGNLSVFTSAGDGTFDPRLDYPVGTGPLAIVTGDFNSDGNLDLAVTLSIDNTVQILTGSASGALTAGQLINSGRNPSALAWADSNGDGLKDIWVAAADDATIEILPSRGSAQFGPTTPVQVAPSVIAHGDLNGDGHEDIVAAHPSLNSLTLMPGASRGIFPQTLTLATATQPSGLLVRDLDGDGRPEILVASADAATLNIHKNLGSAGSFNFGLPQEYAVEGGPSVIRAGDLNQDGRIDVGVLNSTANSLTLLFQQADGTFGVTSRLDTGSSPSDLLLGDFNRDGRIDLAVSQANDGTVGVFRGNGPGTFQARVNYMTSVDFGSNPTALGLADFNSDGRSDIAVLNEGEASVSILLGTLSGEFVLASSTNSAGITPTSMTLGDFNHDGVADVAVSNGSEARVSILLANGNGALSNPTEYVMQGRVTRLLAADLTQEGTLELMAILPDLNAIQVLRGR